MTDLRDPKTWPPHQTQELAALLSLHDAMTELPDKIKGAVSDGLRDAVKDPDVLAAFWKKGYTELTSHATSGASQWVGKRILTAFVIAVTTAGIVWLVKTGALK